MSERYEPPSRSSRIFRTAIGGRPSRLHPDGDARADELWAPGRGMLELSVLASALTILVPVLVLGAIGCAVVARRRGHPRGTVALVAAVWCLLLGVALRHVVGLPIVP